LAHTPDSAHGMGTHPLPSGGASSGAQRNPSRQSKATLGTKAAVGPRARFGLAALRSYGGWQSERAIHHALGFSRADEAHRAAGDREALPVLEHGFSGVAQGFGIGGELRAVFGGSVAPGVTRAGIRLVVDEHDAVVAFEQEIDGTFDATAAVRRGDHRGYGNLAMPNGGGPPLVDPAAQGVAGAQQRFGREQ